MMSRFQTPTMSARFLIGAIFTVYSVGVRPVLAQNNQHNERTWGLGLGALSQERVYRNIKRENLVIPIIRYEGEHLRLAGPSIDIKFPNKTINMENSINYALSIEYSLDGYDDEDIRETRVLTNMDERNGSLWLGGKIQWIRKAYVMEIKYLHDASDYSQGHRLNLGVQRSWVFNSRVLMVANLGFTYLSDEFVDYYYGVEQHEVIPDRQRYTGRSALNLDYGVRLVYRKDLRNAIIFDVNAIEYADAVTDSPIVGNSTEHQTSLSYVYSF